MEDILELIITILLLPFESKIDKLKARVNAMPSKALRLTLKSLMILLPLALLIGLCCLCSYAFLGYWI